jgi:hypothetical protein
MRWAPIAVGLLFLACALAWLGNDSLASRHGYEPGSSLSTAPDGLALARAYLSSQGTDVGTLARPISRLEPVPAAVVFRVVGAPRPRECRAGPCPDAGTPLPADDDEDEDEGAEDAGVLLGQADDDAGVLGRAGGDAGVTAVAVAPDAGPWPLFRRGLLSAEEEGFLAAGGRLVLAVARTDGPPRAETSRDKPVEKVLPLLPGVRELDPEVDGTIPEASLENAVAVFERGGAPLLARRPVGKGDVWLLSNPELFFNARLGKADNLALLVALAGSGRPVLFDEYVHGLLDRPGLLDLLRRWGFGPALFLLALAAVVWFWRGAVTLGPPNPWRDLRTESVDLVHALSQLYQRALRPHDALSLHHARLVHDIQLRFALSPQAAAERARLLTDGWQLPADTAPLGKSEFQRHLDVLNRAIRRLRDERPRRA